MFVVYHIKSTMEKRRYIRERDAKACVKKLNYNQDNPWELYDYTDETTYYNDVVRLVKRVNLMSGKEYWEPSNTPGYMSPASESYWSM